MRNKYYRPNTLDEAMEILNKHKDDNMRILAGGTDLMVQERDAYLNTNKSYERPIIIDINFIKNEIGNINYNSDKDTVEIGSLSTYTDILESEIIKDKLPVVAKSAFAVGGRQIQNMGTVGGMLGTATPAADLTLALLVMEADIFLYSRRGCRKVALKDFFTGYRQTLREPDEIIVNATMPVQSDNEKYTFVKIGGRRGQVIAISAFCGRLILSEDRKEIKKALISAASSAPYSLRLENTENYLTGKKLASLQDKEKEITDKIKKDITPIDEVIATAEYKKYTIINLILDFILNRD
jgi:xanthine dehydrogenase FAD-binding subunit